METITVGLIKGRHDMPCAEYIFEGDVNPLDFEAMRETIRTFLLERRNRHVLRWTSAKRRQPP